MDVYRGLMVTILALGYSGDAAGRPLDPVSIPRVRVDDGFWAPRLEVWRRVTIPDCRAKFEGDGAFVNFERGKAEATMAGRGLS